MNKFVASFLPDEDSLKDKPFAELAQLPTAVYGNLIFLCGFCTTFVAEMIRGTYMTAAGSGCAFLCFLTSLILIKRDKIRVGFILDTVGILIAILAIVFFLHAPDNIFEIYRSTCFIVVMAIFNQLFSLDKKQLSIFFGASCVIWILAIVFLFKDFFIIDKQETIMAIGIGTIAFVGSNAAILLLNKQKDAINDKAIEEQKVTDASLSTIKTVLNQSSKNLEIGNELNSQVLQLSDSFGEIQNLYDYLNTQSVSLTEKTSTISETSKQVMEHVQDMQKNILDQNNALNQTSIAMTEISSSIQNISSIADTRKASMNRMEEDLNSQVIKIDELVHEVEKVQQSTASISNFVATVNAVAGRTGLLAMNASIEAAHAGTLGKGFSVIAQEIRKLSDETNKNAHNIEEELTQIVELVAVADNTAKDCINYTKASNQNIKTSIDGIEEILAGIGQIAIGVDAVLKSLQEVVDTSRTSDTLVGKSVQEINEQNQAISTILEFSNELQGRVQNLEEKLSTAQTALNSVKTIAEENNQSVEQLNQTLKAE